MSGRKYRYFVEGECEKKLFDTYKTSKGLRIKPGKVEVFNISKDRMTYARAMSIHKDSIVIFQYDTDAANIDMVHSNIEFLLKHLRIKRENIIHLMSVLNFEDEIIRATNLKNINELFNTSGLAEFKNKFIRHSNLESKLNSVSFLLERMYSEKPKAPFDGFYTDFKNLLDKGR